MNSPWKSERIFHWSNLANDAGIYSQLASLNNEISFDACGLTKETFSAENAETDRYSSWYPANVTLFASLAHPEAFWIYGQQDLGDFSEEYVRYAGNSMVLHPHYIADAENIPAMSAKLNRAVIRIVKKAAKRKTTAAKVKAVSRAITDTCEYDTGRSTGDICDAAYGCLVNHKAVCGGYARAFRLCMDRLGIESRYELADDNSHIWNWVHVDEHNKPEWTSVDLVYADGPLEEIYVLSEVHFD